MRSGSKRRRHNWRVTIGFFPDAAGALVAQARMLLQFKEKAIPEVGIAVAADRSISAIRNARLYCGLPLPGVSGFPVRINGCFDLNEARTGITLADTAVGAPRERAKWNELLLTVAVPAAYAEALQAIPQPIAESVPAHFYRLWPDLEQIGPSLLRETSIAIHRALADVPIFRCLTTEGPARRRFADIFLLPAPADADLKAALVADGLTIADPPLPVAVVSGASAADIAVFTVTPSLLRLRWVCEERRAWNLEDAPFAALRRREWMRAHRPWGLGGRIAFGLLGDRSVA